MYSMSSHPAVGLVIDEPLYARHLHDCPHIGRPYREKVLAEQPHHSDLELCYKELSRQSPDPARPVVFMKHMTKQFPGLKLEQPPSSCTKAANSIINNDKHIILLRDPISVIQSWSEAVKAGAAGATTLEELGLCEMIQLYSILTGSGKAWHGNNVVVIDSSAILENPERVLTAALKKLGLEFSSKMLSWPSGPKTFDGCWAPHWYTSAHASNGWSKPLPSYKTLDPLYLPIYRLALPMYTTMLSYAEPKVCYIDEPFPDPRNANLLCFIGSSTESGKLFPREQASMVPFDSAVQGGDAVWEGVRVYRGKVFKLERHLQRLFDSAKALHFQNMHTKEQVIDAIFRTLAGNGMRDNAHMRLTLTRGIKCTSSMNPNFNVYGTTLIVLAEWKGTEDRTTYDNTKGVKLITASGRRNSPDMLDSKIHHNNLLNNIMPKIQANNAGAADALMLDKDGFVSETNATNVFMVKGSKVLTPWADACLPGITRESILFLCRELGIGCEERRISLIEFYTSDEVFTSGTMGELTPVYEIDGRTIGDGNGAGPITKKLQEVYKGCPDRPGWSTPLPEFG